jgi:hypothetical protein
MTDSRLTVPRELHADCRNVRQAIRSGEGVIHPSLHPVGMAVVGLGERQSDESHRCQRPHPGQGLCRLSSHCRVFDVQQQCQQHFRCHRDSSKGSKVTPGTNTLRRRRGQGPTQSHLQPDHRVRHSQTLSRPTENIEPGTEARYALDEVHRGTPRLICRPPSP